MKLFGTDGIRGRANEFPITSEVGLRVGQAVAAVLGDQDQRCNRVVLGKDTRISGYMLETAITSGLVSCGMEVYLPGPLPTPAIAHLTKSMGCVAGIMLTASHNPFEDNGVKIFGADGFKLSDETEESIEQHILDQDPPRVNVAPDEIGKAYRIEDARGRYIEYAKQTADNISLSGLKMVVDCGHGAAYSIAPLIFRELGAEVILTGCEPNGVNINQNCGALHPEHTAELVRAHDADIGITFDGDADRVIFIDAAGNPVPGDKIIALTALHLHRQGRLSGNAIAVTVMSNLGLQQAMQRAGIGVVTTPVGDRHIIQALQQGGLSFGGENSGHLIFSEYATTGDGILGALQVLSIMQDQQKSLLQLAACMQEFPQKLINLAVSAKPPLDSLPEVASELDRATRQLGAEGRHLIRYSGTENKIRILVEHSQKAMVEKWSERLKQVIVNNLTSR